MSVKNSNDLQSQPVAQRDRSRSPKNVAKTESDKASTSGESNDDIVVVDSACHVSTGSNPDVVIDHASSSSQDDIVVVDASYHVTDSSNPDVVVHPSPASSKDDSVPVGHDSQAEDLQDSQPQGNPWVENQLYRIVFSSISRGHSSDVMYKRLRYYRAKYEREFGRMSRGELDWETSSDDSQQSEKTVVLGATSQ